MNAHTSKDTCNWRMGYSKLHPKCHGKKMKKIIERLGRLIEL
jgi:hypothetical protein